ncbi:MAG: hypothetical protein GOVbin1807_181 [Prokaryotic dsDNA virus sp.]|nr:MAG: hypothetical protein GOVbin1807_181 [Prokaryotic dsDNA virus sp.]|tara:strand:+ start:8710 stop:9405 length:696 start_codon:yes stop_codon:yes gene_type:complete
MKLTKKKLYKLIIKEIKAFYQSPRPMKKRLMADPDVDKATAMKLYRMLDSEDEADRESAAELMAALGIGEYGEDDEDITVMDTPEFDTERDTPQYSPMYNHNIEQELKLTAKEKNRLRLIASASDNISHKITIIDKLEEKAKRDFRRILPFLMEPEDLPKRGEMNQAAKDAMDLMEKVIDIFYENVEDAFKDLQDTNFIAYESYYDKLSRYMLDYFDDVSKGRKQMEPWDR